MTAISASSTSPASGASASTSARDALRRRLRGVWRGEQNRIHLAGLAQTAAGVLLIDVALFLFDWLFLLPAAVRLVMLAAGFVTLGWWLRRAWFGRLWAYDPARVALKVEERHPALRNLLVTFVQFDGRAAEGEGLSPGLLDGMRAQALKAAQAIDFKARTPDRRLRASLTAALVMALVAGGLMALWPVHVQIAARRNMPPWPALAYPTKTRIARLEWVDADGAIRTLWTRSGHGTIDEWSRTPGDGAPEIVIPEGAVATIRVALIPEGRRPVEATMYWRNRDGAWESTFIPRDVPDPAAKPAGEAALPTPVDVHGDGGEPATYTFRRERLLADFEFWFAVGDARTARIPVKVAAAPRVVEAGVTVKAPAYTRLADTEIAGLDLNGIVAGSTLDWRLSLNEAVSSAEVVLADDNVEPLTLAEDGRSATWSKTLPEPLAYRFRWRRVDYPDFVFEEEVRRQVGIVPDSPPVVEMLKPRRDLKATADKRLDFEYRVADDCGIERVWIAYSLNETEEKRILLEDFTARDAANRRTLEGRHTWVLRDTFPRLVDNDMITVSLVASDRSGKKPNQPTLGRSSSIRMQILSREAYDLYALEMQMGLLDALEATRLESKEIENRIQRTLNPDEEPPNGNP